MTLFSDRIEDAPRLKHRGDLTVEEDEYRYSTMLYNVPNLCLVIVSIKVGQGHPEHAHPEANKALLVLKGRGVIRVGDERFEVKPGSSVLVPRGVVHESINTGDEILEYVQALAP